MKCPKCGYTSFDYLEECKKCNTDLRDVRTLLQIIAISPEDRAPTAPSPRPVAEAADFGPDLSAPLPADDLAGEAETVGPELFGEGDFEDSFEDMVERTRYEETSEATAAPAAPASASEEEDELLDLDFGDLFSDKGQEPQ